MSRNREQAQCPARRRPGRQTSGRARPLAPAAARTGHNRTPCRRCAAGAGRCAVEAGRCAAEAAPGRAPCSCRCGGSPAHRGGCCCTPVAQAGAARRCAASRPARFRERSAACPQTAAGAQGGAPPQPPRRPQSPAPRRLAAAAPGPVPAPARAGAAGPRPNWGSRQGPGRPAGAGRPVAAAARRRPAAPSATAAAARGGCHRRWRFCRRRFCRRRRGARLAADPGPAGRRRRCFGS